MSLLEDPSVWRGISSSENAVAVRTARGAELTWLDDVAVVRSSFHVNDHESGQLLVVGPSRMNYDRVVSMIEYAAQMIEKMYLRGGDGNKYE